MASIAGPIIFTLNVLSAIPLLVLNPDYNQSYKFYTMIFYLIIFTILISMIVFFAVNETTLAWIALGFLFASVLLIIATPKIRDYTSELFEDISLKRSAKKTSGIMRKQMGGVNGPSRAVHKEPSMKRRAKVERMKKPTKIQYAHVPVPSLMLLKPPPKKPYPAKASFPPRRK